MFSTRQWCLWPELPCNHVSKHKGLVTWMEKHRLPYFCKTNLCLHYILCKELISFIRSQEAADMLRWKKADQWLLEKCISGSRGMWRFRSFLQGMAGEELTKFWLAAERILGIDETDESQQDLYVSLFQVLMATHLQEGSVVVTLCSTTIETLLRMSPYHPKHAHTRREVLSDMQKVALFKIESYWLPNFYIHCKLSMEQEPKCSHLLKEYQEQLSRVTFPKSFPFPLPMMSIRESSLASLSYSSLRSKKEVWDHVTGKGPLEGREKHKSKTCGHPRKSVSSKSSPADKKHHISEKQSPSTSMWQGEHINEQDGVGNSDEAPCFKNSPTELPSTPALEEIDEKMYVKKLRASTPVVQYPSMLALKTIMTSPLSLDFLPWVLNADKCAGCPFREFLLSRNYAVEVHLLELWHDLEDFLRMMMCSLGEGNVLLRHVMGERICELYLTQNSNWHLPLKLSTLRGLQRLLPSGNVIPWLLKGQKEICKILCFLYEEFLQHDDKIFLFYVLGKEKKQLTEYLYENDENLRLVRRIMESTHLSQALAGMRDFDLLSGEHWQLLGTQDLGMGGSIFMELDPVVYKIDYVGMKFEELAKMNPKMAVEILSQNFREFCKKYATASGIFIRPMIPKRSLHWTRSSLSFMRKGPLIRKPLIKPRELNEVLQNPIHMDYFRQFLKMHNAETPLLFWMAVEDIIKETNPRAQSELINATVRNFFYHSIPPERLLQCEDKIIRDIKKSRNITLAMLATAQTCVMKCLESRWFKSYQGLYPETEPTFTSHTMKGRRGSFIRDKIKRAWNAFGSLVRTICRFRKAMSYLAKRKAFEEFLHRELKNTKENLPPQGTAQPRLSTGGTSGRSTGSPSSPEEDVEVVQVKRRLFNGRIISVNFLTNDLCFYLEMEKFFHLADSVVVLASLGLYTEKDIAFLRSKVVTIIKLFLNSDIPPKLRVNLTEAQCNQIKNSIGEGVLNRSLFHTAMLSIFSLLIHFWKKYCHWKVMRGFKKRKEEKPADASPTALPKTIHRRPSHYSGEDHPIIRFTLLRGIQLLLPQPKEEVEVLGEKSSTVSISPSKKSSIMSVNQHKRTEYHRYHFAVIRELREPPENQETHNCPGIISGGVKMIAVVSHHVPSLDYSKLFPWVSDAELEVGSKAKSGQMVTFLSSLRTYMDYHFTRVKGGKERPPALSAEAAGQEGHIL
ncbi:regulator of G-protein signaling protein-like [Eublepharis macularius]|uniref:Regulator of G-protein signaling protein-like n=1 Tax=Eublepharis macularius TaxID=481883 RepID=A0AA97JFI9_EUBMA|nr:regulator of G-protein signaling protein-like [Eublepharis macularius]